MAEKEKPVIRVQPVGKSHRVKTLPTKEEKQLTARDVIRKLIEHGLDDPIQVKVKHLGQGPLTEIRIESNEIVFIGPPKQRFIIKVRETK